MGRNQSIRGSCYFNIISDLPIPTAEQCRRFAVFVSDAHSWYKHLPLDPPSPFYFFLDPNAGRQMARTLFGNIRYRDIREDGGHFHYSTKRTSWYREQFGYWNYHAPYGTKFIIPTEGGVVDTESSPGLMVHDVRNRRCAIPEELVRVGKVNLTALVHPIRNYHLYWTQDPDNPSTIYTFPEVFERQVTGLPDTVRTGIQSFLRLIEQRGSLLPGQLQEIEPLDSQIEELLHRTITPALDGIRSNQLLGMERAMREFIDLISKKRSKNSS